MRLPEKNYGYADMYTMSFKTSPLYSLLFAIKTSVDALLPTLSIFVTAQFLNTAMDVYNHKAGFSSVYGSIALIAVMMLYNTFINTVMNFVECRRGIIFRRKFIPVIVEKQAQLAYHHMENPETADLIKRTCPTFDTHVWQMYTNLLAVAGFVVYVLGILGTLFAQVWWIALVMLAASAPIIYFGAKSGRQRYDGFKESAELERRADYLSEVLASREAVEERSVFGYTQHLNAQYMEKREHAHHIRLRYILRNFVGAHLRGLLVSVFSIGMVLMMIYPAMDGTVSIGMFIAIMGAVFGLANRLSWGLSGVVADIAEQRAFLRDVTAFVALEAHPHATAFPDPCVSFHTLAFQHVSFAYPGTDRPILCDVSFTIERGKHYAFVGANGAGKTTITKLITGLYTNYTGDICVDGRSLRAFTPAEIKGLSAVVYQDFAKYFISLYDNIAIADLYGEASVTEKHTHAEQAMAVLGLSDAVDRLPKGMDTPLGKIMPGGVDISGGEWQRVALARRMMSPAPLRILDEPTAALDPLSESKVYQQFEQISRSMTTVFISHRLGATKLADVIFVLSEGTIAEYGSHTALMDKKGIYCHMYNTQAAWYTGAEGKGGAADA